MNKPDKSRWHHKFLRILHDVVSMPFAVVFLTFSRKVHPSYNMPHWRRILLGLRFWRNHRRVTSGTSWRAHLVMATKILELPPAFPGDVVECGCWKGGATVNLSLVCKIVGRRLKVYDSFEGLPPPVKGDEIAERTFRNGYLPGVFGGTLDEVKQNVARCGAADVCSYHPGWFADSLPGHEGPIAVMFLDVDFYASLHDCLLHLWPSVSDGGLVFLDEYINLPYCAVFYSEKYWDKYFSCAPPGLIGAGTGVQVGMHYVDPTVRFQPNHLQGVSRSVAYCKKGSRTLWEFYPDEQDADVAGDNTGSSTT
ncbi:MAG: TylF/MycF/NovP-related O-methyltransferase [Halioglobus sp.]